LTQIAFLLYPNMTALDAVEAHETSTGTTSVCTGSLLLGAAGVLEGKVITAAGVSAGVDMALWLAAAEAGEDEARTLQLVIEYDPESPFDSGALEKADEPTRRRATAHMTGSDAQAEVVG
jgi:putative intracellular protease/amidase